MSDAPYMPDPPDEFTGPVPPQHIEAEACVLGSMILHSPCVPDVERIVREDDFYRPAHATIFRTLIEMTAAQEPVDLVTLRNALTARGQLESVGGIDYLVALAEGVPSAANAEYYSRLVREKSTLRQIIVLGTEMAAAARGADAKPEAVLAEYEQQIYALSMGYDRRGLVTAAEAGQVVLDDARAVQAGEKAPALSLGFPSLDVYTGGGVRPGQLIVLGAYTSMGKTSLATRMAMHVVASAHSALFFSMEMTADELATRMLAVLSEIDSLQIMRGQLQKWHWEALEGAQAMLEGWGRRYTLCERPLPPAGIAAEIRRMAARLRKPLDLAVVDYLQITPATGGRTERERINSITREMKMVAMSLKTPILLLSQISRASIHAGEPPELKDLKESGNIENDANGVLLLHRPKDSQTDQMSGGYDIQCRVAKWRNGITTGWGAAPRLHFLPAQTDFRDYRQETEE